MKNTNTVLILATSIALSACGPKSNEPTTYGVSNSKWSSMSVTQKAEAQQRYEHEIRVSEQRRMELMYKEQNEKQARAQIEGRLLNLERKNEQVVASAPGHANAQQVPTTIVIQQPTVSQAQPQAQYQQAPAQYAQPQPQYQQQVPAQYAQPQPQYQQQAPAQYAQPQAQYQQPPAQYQQAPANNQIAQVPAPQQMLQPQSGTMPNNAG